MDYLVDMGQWHHESSHSYLAVSGAQADLPRGEGLGNHGPSGRKFSKRPNYDRLGSVVLAQALD
ncbi:hypothetical protein N7489_006530 [Penicillium chrysogenum]|jgi:hypothetical protein|uniref:Uncharacterized protein n=1 Tax=Penicillium chrysogenum TaxID=5076 RepID=A0ABQ8W3W3_PENCH|nr:uncharacterized protein N7489_006530 [Penicillium chrysogenum]KAJ5846504.1 hypothetical protein N7534_010173 [Penicillium rubens]KAJ5236439.1 hypothetical protein N7489_006530 [Penicillium chrysogenum]KAJ5255344.1 hypothetical protein N7505_010495 [Penicillium chrysogenum]KAJ5276383.1 hypothetical protein N7524_002536 [Penicillium chrysogenum]KAJ6152852.1 hypothetical protein N7497_007171 [Penicillium chrysogenum]